MNWQQLTDRERENALSAWITADGRVDKFLKLVDRQIRAIDIDEVVEALGAELWLPSDPAYPPRVRERLVTAGPWFIRGELPNARMLGVVGSRAVDHEGVRLCKAIVREVAAAGVAIVSGGAIGVDTLAHEAALSVGTATVAVLPSAFDRVTPARNKKLFARIAEQGALISEYPPGVTAHRFHFHRRNRIIAALSDAVLVVRAKAKSGTMLTARAAQELGTPVFAVPGSPEDETAAGCNMLLREGARCVTSAAEVLEELGIADDAPLAPKQQRLDLSSNARTLVAALDTPLSTAELCEVTGLPPHAALVALTELEIACAVESVGGRWRAK